MSCALSCFIHFYFRCIATNFSEATEREQQTQEHIIHQVAGIGSFPADVTSVTKTGFSSVYSSVGR